MEYIITVDNEIDESTVHYFDKTDLVRCKDCCNYRPDRPEDGYCENLHKDVKKDWFCADGEV